jgi:hypothetical protein
VAIQCKYCGADLPKDDARFCNKCGMLVPSHPFSPQSLSVSKSNAKIAGPSSSGEQQERQKRVLHEQVAEWSPARSKPNHLEQDEPIKMSDELEQEASEPEEHLSNQSSLVEEVPLENLPETPQPAFEEDVSSPAGEVMGQVAPVVSSRQVRRPLPQSAQIQSSVPPWPAPVTHVAGKEASAPERKRLYEQNGNNEAASAHEFRRNIWKDEGKQQRADVENTAIEDALTQSVSIPVEDLPTQAVSMPVEDLPTRAIPVPIEKPSQVQEQVAKRVPSNPFLSVPSTQEEAQEKSEKDGGARANATSSGPVNPSSSTAFQPGAAPFISSQGYQSESMPGSVTQARGNAAPVRRPRRWWPIVVVFVVLVVLVIGGLIAAMMVSQQPVNNAIIQSQVNFSDTQLGISLLYPNGWTRQVNTGMSTAHFYASNHVGEIDIIVAANGNAQQALQQQATKMGMSGKKTETALNFASASWQQLQGTLQVSGASFTDTLLATSHGGQLFIIVQQAPQNDYADWEKEFFAPLRSSFKFL